MKQKLILAVLLTGCISLLFAYNPSAGGELMYQLQTPDVLADGASVAGGALFSASAEHIAINPALTSEEQRIVINLDYTALAGSSYGQTMFLGTIFPTKYGVLTFSGQGIFATLDELDLGNCFTMRAGFSKDISEELYVGTDLACTIGSGFGIYGDFGFYYKAGSVKWLPFLKDVKFGGVLTGCGLPYNNSSKSALDSEEAVTGFPGLVTPHAGLSGTLVTTDKFKMGLSADLAFPTFQNIVFDTGLQMLIADFVRVRTGWNFNLRECMAGKASYIPSIAVSAKIAFKTQNSFMNKNGWAESEVEIPAGYRQLTGGVHAISAGATLHLGMQDNKEPVIKLWDGEDDE